MITELDLTKAGYRPYPYHGPNMFGAKRYALTDSISDIETFYHLIYSGNDLCYVPDPYNH